MATNPFGYSGFGGASAFGEPARKAAFGQNTRDHTLRQIRQAATGQIDTDRRDMSRLSPDGDPAARTDPSSFSGAAELLRNSQAGYNPATLANRSAMTGAPLSALMSSATPSPGSGAGGGASAALAPIAPSTSAPGATVPSTNGSGLPTPGSTPLGSGRAQTAFGQSFKPEAYGEAWNDPASVIQAWLNQNKVASGSGQGAMLQDQADNMGILYMLLNGDDVSQGTGHYLDWSGEYLQNLQRPGAQTHTPMDVWRGMTAITEDDLMYHNLYGEDMLPSQQVDAVLGTTRYGMEGTLPAPILDALLARMTGMGRDYTSQAMTSNPQDNFGKYMATKGLSYQDFM